MARKKLRQKKDKYLLMSWKKLLYLVLAWVASVLLHNFISAIFGFEEALFFIIAVFIIPIYFIVSIIYTIAKKLR